MPETATATITATQIASDSYSYSLTLHDTGSTTVGTFWFAWVPGRDFMDVSPNSVSSPPGWTDAITHAGSNDGYAIQWHVTSPSSGEVQSGGSLSGFSFTSSESPAQLFGDSSFYPGTAELTSFLYSGEPFSDGGFQFVVEPACFLAGTCILTDKGEKQVEDLAVGDMVFTLSGDTRVLRPVKWIGYRRIDMALHPRPDKVAPIRIRKHAFAEGTPHRDLLVSPDHGIFADGKLICARQLINGTTIVRETGSTSIAYFHVELDQHALLLAEGLPTESYLDTGNRGLFANANGPLQLHPDLADGPDYPTREAGSCMPFVWDDASVRPVWQRLARRAAAVGQAVPWHVTTTEANLRVVDKHTDDHGIRPIHSDSNLAVFVLPRGVQEISLVSRAQAPTVARPWLEDRRRLGVCVKRVVLRALNEQRVIPLDHPDLSQGWWAVEHDGQQMSRWTNGDAVLRLPGMHGAAVLEIHLADAMTYIVDGEMPEVGVTVA